MSLITTRTVPVALLVLVLALALVASLALRPAPSTGATPLPASQQKLVLNIGGAPSTIDPGRAADITSQSVVNMLFQGLTEQRTGGAPTAGAAQSWSVSADKRTWTFVLRPNLRWSDGTALTASHFKYAWLRNLHPSTRSQHSYLLMDIKGAGAYARGVTSPSSVAISVPSARVLKVTTVRATPWFASLVAQPVFFPLPSHVIARHDAAWTQVANFESNGAFRLTARTSGGTGMVRSTTFWNAARTRLQQVILRYLGPGDAYRAYNRGAIHGGLAGTMIPDSRMPAAMSVPGFRWVHVAANQLLWMNTTDPRLRDRRVRAGISMAIDRRDLAPYALPTATFSMAGLPGAAVVRGGSGGFIRPNAAPDTARAANLLANGGWSGPSEGQLRLAFTAQGGALAPAVAQQVKANLAAVGVPVRLVQLSTFDALLQMASSPSNNYDLLLLGWMIDFPDQYNVLSVLQSGSDLNASGWQRPAYDDGLSRARGTMNAGDRYRVERQLEAMLTSSAGSHPAAPLYQDRGRTLLKPKLTGEAFGPMGLLHLDRAVLMS